jgi:hypothetical protein
LMPFEVAMRILVLYQSKDILRKTTRWLNFDRRR